MKMQVDESYVLKPDEVLNEFIRQNFEECMQAGKALRRKQTDAEPLNSFFRTTIGF